MGRWRFSVVVCLGFLVWGGAAKSFDPTHPPKTSYCPPYTLSPLYRARTRQVAVDPSNWRQAIFSAQNGDELLFADGDYTMQPGASKTWITKSITLRSASRKRDNVRIHGLGYSYSADDTEVFQVAAPDLTIADLTITDARNHAISIHPYSGARNTHIYNVHLYNIGTQHIKGNYIDGSGPKGNEGVVIACSSLGYTEGGVAGDYIGPIDLHDAHNAVIRDNVIYNSWGDGTGREVYDPSSGLEPGGGPAILIWNHSKNVTLERNIILDSFRGIAIGFGTPHDGGVVRNNFFYQSLASKNGVNGDMGIQLYTATNVSVDHNTVILGSSYPGPIEVRNASNNWIRNNLINLPVRNRGSSTYNGICSQENCDDTLYGNKVDASVEDLAVAGEPALAPDSAAVDYTSALDLPAVTTDWQGDPRPTGEHADAGADEVFYALAGSCSDGLDNDGDGLIDYPADPGCSQATSPLENPRCNDGVDNDGDGQTDFGEDSNCTSASWNAEQPLSCGNGYQLVFGVPLLVFGLRRGKARKVSEP